MEAIAEEMQEFRAQLNAALQSTARPPSAPQADVEESMIGRELLELRRSVDVIWNLPHASQHASMPALQREIENLKQHLMVVAAQTEPPLELVPEKDMGNREDARKSNPLPNQKRKNSTSPAAAQQPTQS